MSGSVSPWSGPGGNALQLPKEDLASALRVIPAPEACTVRRICGRAAHDHHGYLARVEMELLVFSSCVPRCAEVRNKVVAEMAKKVMKRLREEVVKRSLKLSVNENGKEGKSKTIASCGFLEEEQRQVNREGVTMADSVETLGVDLRTRAKKSWEQKNRRG